ncbi:hypothetical protein QUA71_21710 [Microcoleus sp. MON1_C5]
MGKNFYVTIMLIVTISAGLYFFKYSASWSDYEKSVQTRDVDQLATLDHNPLLTATRKQFDRWLPSYCGPDLYLNKNAKPHSVEVCINGTIERIESSTGIVLSKEDVTDTRVKTHWQQIMGVN